MEEFARMVEIYKWSGPSTQQKQTSAVNQQEDEGPLSSVCSELSPDINGIKENYSSPSPSLQHSAAHNGSVQAMEAQAESSNASDRPLSFAAGWHKPRQKAKAKKKLRSAPSRSSRQLVFSVEEIVPEDNMQRKVKSERTAKKIRGNVKRKGSKHDEIGFISQTEACNALDSCNGSICENGPAAAHEFNSPDVWYPPVHGGTGKTKRRSQHASMSGKSPYFMPSKRKNTIGGSNKNNSRLINKARFSTAESKVFTQMRLNKGFYLERKAGRTDVKHVAGQDGECLNCQDSGDSSAHSSKQLVSSLDLDIPLTKATSRIRKSAYFETPVKALGQRDISNKTWVPPISVHALIQEELYKDPWKVLVACMLLNKTSGEQMRKIIWNLFDLCPTPEAAVSIETTKIEDVIHGLGLQKKRALMIQKFSKDFLGKDWTNVGQLHGIGKYATDAYAIFCEGRWQEVKPEDHKLVDYWKYLCATDGLGYAFKDDREKSQEVPVQVTSMES